MRSPRFRQEPTGDTAKVSSELANVIRELLVKPVTLWVTVGATLFTVVFAPGSFMGELSLWARLAINSVNAFAFWAFTYWALGAWIAFGLARRLPWAPMQVLFYTPFAAANVILYSVYLTNTATIATAFAGFGAVMAMVLVTVLFTLLIFRRFLDDVLERSGYRGCLFRWSPAPAAPGEGSGAQPILLKAANQYVEVVRPTDTELVRTTLKAAIAEQVADAGMQINRSTWVAWTGIRTVARDRDRLLVTLSDGSAVHVSRGTVERFRNAWQARGGTYAPDVERQFRGD